MKTYTEIKESVKKIITQVADQQDIPIPELQDHHAVVDDLHFSSLDVATLTALFEREFHVNPFMMGIAAITEIRTIHEIASVYEKAIRVKENPAEQSLTIESHSRSAKRKEAQHRKNRDKDKE